MRVLIAAGGSGGHIFPAIALGRTLKRLNTDTETLFVGTDRSLDKRLYEKERVHYKLLSTNKLPYRPTPGLILIFTRLLFDIARSFSIILSYKPDAVVGFGGYVSFPVLAVAYLLRIPRIVHEQNAVPGRANRALFKFADKVAISFEETRNFLGPRGGKALLTGNPVRSGMLKEDRAWGLRRFGLDTGKFTILVIGGSQGAHVLNKTFIEALMLIDRELKSGLQVIHITGVKDYEWALSEYVQAGIDYRVHSFIDRIEEAYAACDLAVTRSGASALFELALLGKPMILVPYPFAMSHQAENAAAFSRTGAAVLLDENSLSAGIFKDTVLGLVNDRERLRALGSRARRLSAPEAADILAGTIIGLARGEK